MDILGSLNISNLGIPTSADSITTLDVSSNGTVINNNSYIKYTKQYYEFTGYSSNSVVLPLLSRMTSGVINIYIQHKLVNII